MFQFLHKVLPRGAESQDAIKIGPIKRWKGIRAIVFTSFFTDVSGKRKANTAMDRNVGGGGCLALSDNKLKIKNRNSVPENLNYFMLLHSWMLD